MPNYATGGVPEQLDPAPTLFGTARIAPLEGPEGTTEYSRAVQWLNNRAARFAFGAFLRTKLIGSPIAAANIRASTQPLRDFITDLRKPDDQLDDDEVYGHPISNWGPNQ